MLLVTSENLVIDCNPVFAQLALGCSREDVVGKVCTEWIELLFFITRMMHGLFFIQRNLVMFLSTSQSSAAVSIKASCIMRMARLSLCRTWSMAQWKAWTFIKCGSPFPLRLLATITNPSRNRPKPPKYHRLCPPAEKRKAAKFSRAKCALENTFSITRCVESLAMFAEKYHFKYLICVIYSLSRKLVVEALAQSISLAVPLTVNWW